MALSSAFAQESVNKVSSYLSGKLIDVTSRENLVTRMEIAVSKLGLAIERSGKLPITDASLLWQRKVFKRVCSQGKELLRTHHQQQQLPLERREDVGQVVTSSSFLGRISCVAKNSILSVLGFHNGDLSSSAVNNFENYAMSADKFLEDVASGCSLWKYMISNNPLFRLLLEGKTLYFRANKGTFQKQGILIWTSHYEERGVEATLTYFYEDLKMPENDFYLGMVLRFSESTDIIGTAIKCLQPLLSQFKVAAEYAIVDGLSQHAADTSNLLVISPSSMHFLVPYKKGFADVSHLCRPDPICCWSNEHGPTGHKSASSELSQICPEEVIFFLVYFHVLLEKKYSLRRSSDKASRSVMLPLDAYALFMPHRDVEKDKLRELQLAGFDAPFSRERGTNHDYRSISIQELLDTVGSTAIQRYLNRPELTVFEIDWVSKHGVAYFSVEKPTTRRSGKRRR